MKSQAQGAILFTEAFVFGKFANAAGDIAGHDCNVTQTAQWAEVTKVEPLRE